MYSIDPLEKALKDGASPEEIRQICCDRVIPDEHRAEIWKVISANLVFVQ